MGRQRPITLPIVVSQPDTSLSMNDLLNYHISEPSSNKPWLVLIHGLFGNLDNLAVIRRELQQEYKVLSVDLLDHGLSPRSEKFSFLSNAEYLHRVFQHLHIEHAHVLGHSLGGKVAMTFALTYPQKVDKLILADIAPVAYSQRHQTVIDGLNSVDLSSLQGRSQADQMMSQHIVESGVRQFLLKSLVNEEQQWRWRFNLPLLQRDYANVSAAIDSQGNKFEGEVLFIKGGKSDYLLPEHQSAIAALFPNSQAKVIAGAGHWLHAEKPVIFNRLVSTFLQQ